jgi:hypothetical protein
MTPAKVKAPRRGTPKPSPSSAGTHDSVGTIPPFTGPLGHLCFQGSIMGEVAAGRLSTTAGHLAAVLAVHLRNETDACEIGSRRLRRMTGRRPAILQRARAELEAAGWVALVVGDPGNRTRYERTYPAGWCVKPDVVGALMEPEEPAEVGNEVTQGVVRA